MIILGLRLGAGAEGAPVSHDQVLAALSFIVAAATIYAALELSERFFAAQRAARLKWLAACAVILGGGVWSMHAIGLAALESPFERGYNAGILGAAALTVVLAVAGALWIVRESAGLFRLAAAGALLGAGVVVMHILGEQALVVAGDLVHQPARVVFSALLSIAAGVGAVWAAARARAWWKRIAAAFALAVGFALAHYIGSPAAVIAAAGASEAGAPVLLDAVLSATIAYAMIAIATFGLVGAYLERRIEDYKRNEAHHIRQIKDSLEQRVDQRTAHLMRTAQNLDASLRNAERSSAAKSDFLASLSHELRTPLNAILGFTQLLMRGKGEAQLSGDQSRKLEQIERAGRHLLTLINEVLELSRIEAGRLSLSIEPLNAVDFVQDVVDSFQTIAVDAGVTIHVHAPEGYVGVMADRVRLRQVLTNLISNAVKYNTRGGEVDVEVLVHHVQNRVGFAVRDTGIGIPEGRMGELFEPFNRLGNDNSAVSGAGVGLALCKRLVEAQAGEIWAESREDRKGSVFTFVLPLSASPAHEAARAAEDAGPRSRVLYVEDNPSNVLLMRQIVEDIDGVELIVATNAADGVEYALEVAPDVILLDINLPDSDGFRVMEVLRSDPATEMIPVIAVTANAMPDDVERGREAGFLAYLTKPFDIEDILSALGEAFGALPEPELRRRVNKSLSEHARAVEVADE